MNTGAHIVSNTPRPITVILSRENVIHEMKTMHLTQNIFKLEFLIRDQNYVT